MRTYGRVRQPDGTQQWVEVTTDAEGNDTYVWLTTLTQCLLLNLGESPFFANYGIPGQRAVLQQIFPDFYVQQTVSQFSSQFATLRIKKLPLPDPTYDVFVVTKQGTTFNPVIAK